MNNNKHSTNFTINKYNNNYKNNNANNYNKNINLNKNVNRKPKQLVAECRDMCPEDEVNLRIKNNLVNVLEKCFVK